MSLDMNSKRAVQDTHFEISRQILVMRSDESVERIQICCDGLSDWCLDNRLFFDAR